MYKYWQKHGFRTTSIDKEGNISTQFPSASSENVPITSLCQSGNIFNGTSYDFYEKIGPVFAIETRGI